MTGIFLRFQSRPLVGSDFNVAQKVNSRHFQSYRFPLWERLAKRLPIKREAGINSRFCVGANLIGMVGIIDTDIHVFLCGRAFHRGTSLL